MAICRNPNCGKENSDDLIFCKYCGRRLKEPRNYSKMPLQFVGVFAGLIIILIILKIAFSFGTNDSDNQPKINSPIDQNQNDTDEIIDSQLKYKLVISKGRGTAKELYIYNVDGTVEQLTNSNAQNILPSVSPDGTKVVFERIENDKTNIYIINIDGSGEKKLVEGYAPTWSANGSKITFYRKNKNSIANSLYSIKLDGTGEKTEENVEDSFYMARYSNDGSKVALTKYSIEGWGIYTVNPDFTGRKTLTTSNQELGNPSWSPDGSIITYQSKKNGNFDIFSVDLNKNVIRLTDSELPDMSPVFTPDGKILFTREEMGTLNIYIMDSDGNNQKLLIKDAGYATIVE